MIRAIAVDKDTAALDLLKKYCSLTAGIDMVKCFTKNEEAVFYLDRYPADLLFIDVQSQQMPPLLFRKITPQGRMVIFATASSQFAVEAFNHNAVDYLLKPFDYDRFLRSAEKATARYRFMQQEAPGRMENIALRADYALVNLALSKIIYIEAMDDYIRIFMRDQKPVVTRMTMKSLEEKLPKKAFARVHKSYIIPVDRIDYIRNKVVHIDNHRIPVGICYEQKFFNLINNTTWKPS